MTEEITRKEAFIQWMFPTQAQAVVAVILCLSGFGLVAIAILPVAYALAKAEKRNLYLGIYCATIFLGPFLALGLSAMFSAMFSI